MSPTKSLAAMLALLMTVGVACSNDAATAETATADDTTAAVVTETDTDATTDTDTDTESATAESAAVDTTVSETARQGGPGGVVDPASVGHSITLVASALGWVSVPSRPVEVLIALSVAVSAAHAIRPLARRGEELIAVGFGLVHGLAFAGILADLGLEGTTSVLALFGFNLGIELSQLAVTALVFPSLYLLSRTRFEPVFRVGAATFALVAALGWAVERLGGLTNPFEPITDAAVANPWWVVSGLAMLAATAASAAVSWAAVPVPRRAPPHRFSPRHVSESIDERGRDDY